MGEKLHQPKSETEVVPGSEPALRALLKEPALAVDKVWWVLGLILSVLFLGQPVTWAQDDLVFANDVQPNRICVNGGAGGYTCSDVSADLFRSFGVAVADLDGQNGSDLIFANNGQRNRKCLGDGAGGYACSDISIDAFGSTGVAVADLDGQNGLDLVFANWGQPNRKCLADGAGGYTCASVSADSLQSYDMAVADLDGQSGPDLVFANWSQPNRKCLNDGAGGYTCSNVSADAFGSRGVQVAQLDGVNGLDLVFANQGQPNRKCLDDGAGGYTCSSVSANSFLSYDVAVADLDGQNGLDLVFGNLNQANRKCLGDGAGGYTCSDVSADIPQWSYGVAVADLDGQNGLDLIFANYYTSLNRKCLADGAGGYTCSDVSVSDFNSTTRVASIPAGGGPCSQTLSLSLGIWELFSVACDPGSATWQALLTTAGSGPLDPALYGVGGTGWGLWEFNPGTQAYVAPDIATAVPQRGRGYFIKTYSAVPGISLDGGAWATPPYDLPLAAGWNLVGNPFDADATWDDNLTKVEVFDNLNVSRGTLSGAVGSVLERRTRYTWTGGGYDGRNPGATSFVAKGKGFWVKGLVNGAYLRYKVTGAGPLPVRAASVSDGWTVNLSVESGLLRDPWNQLGVRRGAADGFGVEDVWELPADMEPFLSVVFPHSEWGGDAGDYQTDLRSLAADTSEEWQFEVRSSEASGEAVLRWSGPPDLLARSRVYDEKRGQVVSGLEGEYYFQLDGQPRKFRWFLDRAGGGGVGGPASTPARDGGPFLLVLLLFTGLLAVRRQVRARK